jgi:hypothetical protein
MASEQELNRAQELLKQQEAINKAREKQKEIDADILGLSSGLVDSIKEVQGLSTKRTTFDRNILKVNQDINKELLGQKSGLSDVSTIQKQIQKNSNLIEISTKTQQGILNGLSANEKRRVELANKRVEQIRTQSDIQKQLLKETEQGGELDRKAYDDAVATQKQKEAALENIIRQLGPLAQQAIFTKQNTVELEKQNKEREEEEKQLQNINEALGLGGQAISGIGQALSKMGFGGLAGKLGLKDAKTKMKEVADEVTNGGKQTASFADKTKVLKAGFSSMKGSLISNLTDPLSIGVFLVNEMFQALKGADKATGDLAYGMNMTYSEASGVRNELNTAANLSGSIYVNTKGMQESLLAINQSLGTSVSLNSKNLVTFTKFREAAHLSNEELMGMQSLAMATNGDLESMTGEFLAQAQITATNNKAVLNEKQLLAEISKTSAATTLSLGKNPGLIAEAAATAKSLGMEMSKVEGIAGSLLDFESSIESELQAELLLGKDINLEKARQAALNNDLATVAEEIAKQAGSAAEFGAMNRIQQDALAKSVGMSREELAKTLFVQEQIGNVSAEEAKIKEKYINDLQAKGLSQDEIKEKLANTSLKTLEKQSSMQAKLNKSVEKLREVFVSIAQPVLQIIEPLASLVTTILPAVNILLQPIFFVIKSIGDAVQGFTSLIKGDLKDGLGGVAQIAQSIAVIWGGIVLGAKILGKETLKNITLQNTLGRLLKADFYKSLGSAIAKAYGAIVSFLGPFGIPVAIAASAGLVGLATKFFSKGDDVMSPGQGSPGYGNRTLFGPEGAISLNNKDTVIAGTDLFKPENKIQPQTPTNTPPVVQQTVVQPSDNTESKKTNALLEQILTKQGTVKMDSVDVGTSFAMNTYEVQ